tara:strand:- start:700 stop:2910 length:2211 start_codon:yes stop_codon:yes gene_type:complete
MTIVDQALAVARSGYSVFPTQNKMPVHSNASLGVKRGEGGFHIATTDPDRIRELFSHERATEIAVPCGPSFGCNIITVDVDLYKDPALVGWINDNAEHLEGTLVHETRSGGVHYIFQHPASEIKLPATLREGVDLKGHGGYICFPPTEGYKARNKKKPLPFPLELLKNAQIARGGTGSLTTGSGFNQASDEALIQRIVSASEIYPSLRTLSMRLPTRRMEDGNLYNQDQMVKVLQDIMNDSVAADEGHGRHEDWSQRYGSIEHLISTALDKTTGLGNDLSDTELSAMMQGQSFIDTQKVLAEAALAAKKPGVQPEVSQKSIEAQIEILEAAQVQTNILNIDGSALLSGGPSLFDCVSANSLINENIPPISYVVPGWLPRGALFSLAGTSNVGKTRWLCAFAALGSCGRLDLMGLPKADPFTIMLVCNEERVDDLCRRLLSVFKQYNIKDSGNIYIRGKDKGMTRIIGMNEIGQPEIDTKNIAALAFEAKQAKADVMAFDPYTTLSEGMDENSAQSASMMTKGMLLLSVAANDCATGHLHHTPKGARTDDKDFYRADQLGWRGSSGIYSALDVGWTISPYWPNNKEQRKAWKAAYVEQNLSRWVVLDVGKLREGTPPPPVVMELVGQDIGNGQEIGVLRLSNPQEAENSILGGAIDAIQVAGICDALYKHFDYADGISLNKAHKKLVDDPMCSWPGVGNKLQSGSKTEEVKAMFEGGVYFSEGKVTIKEKGFTIAKQ